MSAVRPLFLRIWSMLMNTTMHEAEVMQVGDADAVMRSARNCRVSGFEGRELCVVGGVERDMFGAVQCSAVSRLHPHGLALIGEV